MPPTIVLPAASSATAEHSVLPVPNEVEKTSALPSGASFCTSHPIAVAAFTVPEMTMPPFESTAMEGL